MKNNLITLSNFRIENSLKNILIFFPLFFSKREIFFYDVIHLAIGFIIFTFITSVCYITNDFTDRKKDKNNKLKKKNTSLKKETVIIVNILLFIFLFLIFLMTNFGNIYLILYLSVFYLYNYFLKYVFLLDVIVLVCFYILRLYYGAELLNIVISYWFLMFFIPLFLNLALFKRIIQITVNHIKKSSNSIIKYSLENIPLIKKIILISTLVNFLIAFLYFFELFNPDTFPFFSTQETRYNHNIIFLIFTFLAYIFWTWRITSLVFNGFVKKDIYRFIITDKITYLFFVIFSAMILI